MNSSSESLICPKTRQTLNMDNNIIIIVSNLCIILINRITFKRFFDNYWRIYLLLKEFLALTYLIIYLYDRLDKLTTKPYFYFNGFMFT